MEYNNEIRKRFNVSYGMLLFRSSHKVVNLGYYVATECLINYIN